MPASTTSTRSPCCSGEPVPPSPWAEEEACKVGRPRAPEPHSPLTRGQSPHPARFSLRTSSETPFSRFLDTWACDLSSVHTELLSACPLAGHPSPKGWVQPGFVVATSTGMLHLYSVYSWGNARRQRESGQCICHDQVPVGKGFRLIRSRECYLNS